MASIFDEPERQRPPLTSVAASFKAKMKADRKALLASYIARRDDINANEHGYTRDELFAAMGLLALHDTAKKSGLSLDAVIQNKFSFTKQEIHAALGAGWDGKNEQGRTRAEILAALGADAAAEVQKAAVLVKTILEAVKSGNLDPSDTVPVATIVFPQ